MAFLASIPTWAYFAMILFTYVATHVLTFDPTRVLPPQRAFIGRIVSAVLLLIALVLFRAVEPATVLLSLLLALAGGFLSGRSTQPPKAPPARRGPDEERR